MTAAIDPAAPGQSEVQPQSTAIARQPAKVAVLLPLSGQVQTTLVAKGLRQASEMALFDFDDPNVELVVKDDKGTAEGAKLAAEAAVQAGAELIIGPLFSQAVQGAIPVARASGVPIIAFSNDRSLAAPGVYLLSFLVEPEIERIVGYAAGQGKRRMAALIPSDAYGSAVEATFRAAAGRHGVDIAVVERYAPEANAMLEPARNIGAAIAAAEASGAPVDALFIPGGQEIVPRLGPLLTYAKIDPSKVKLLGTGGLDYPNAGREPALVGAWFAGPDPRGWQQFSARYAKVYGAPPPRLSTLAYDAVALASALSSAPRGQRYVAANLTRPGGFNGVDGRLRLLPDGMVERALAVLEVQQFGANVVEAPASPVQSTQMLLAGPRT